MEIYLGTAGWTLPKQHAAYFSAVVEGAKVSRLERYASQLRCVEINSSFHRPHKRTTWERWAATTPADFRFAVKAPKAITHTAKLVNTGPALLEFFDAVGGLGNKLGPVLFQLPPKQVYDEGVTREFFTTLRELHAGAIVLEPRHSSWFNASVNRLLRSFEVARVAADPPKGSELAGEPGGRAGLFYWRLHGSPRTYYSNYDEAWLRQFTDRIRLLEGRAELKEIWVVFDNTAMGHATANAISLRDLLLERPSSSGLPKRPSHSPGPHINS
jgi:uncharacterized protein YecE (DUF72 family)